MDVLLIGADNPVGVALSGAFSQWGRHQPIALNTAASRWKSERQAKKAARRGKPQVIVDTRLAWQTAAGEIPSDLDIDSCHWVAKACERSDICYFLLSTDTVFSGHLHRQLRESDPRDASAEAAVGIVSAEERVLESAPTSIVLRSGPIFASFDVNPLTALLDTIDADRRVSCDDLHSFCPVASVDLARVVAAMLDQLGAGADASGVYHYCSSDRTTQYGFAEAALAAASQYSDCGDVVLNADRESADEEEMRVLDCSRLLNSFAIKQVPWRGFINAIVKQYYLNVQEGI